MQLRVGGSALELTVPGRRPVRCDRAETRLASSVWTGRAPAACRRPLWGICCSKKCIVSHYFAWLDGCSVGMAERRRTFSDHIVRTFRRA